jgi:DNA-binding response OmpR family regulator
MPGRSVLIVDDEPAIVASLEFLMQQEGYSVRVATDGYDALAAVSEAAPDLVLLDVMLPTLDGFEVCRRLREVAVGNALRIVILTARQHERERALLVGADAFLTKPFGTRELVAEVERVMRSAPQGPA